MATHPRPASDAGKLLRTRLTPPNVRRVAASDLAQTARPVSKLPKSQTPQRVSRPVSRLRRPKS